MLDKIEISINKNHYVIKYQGFTKKTTDKEVIHNILFKDYGNLVSYTKNGNDLFLNFQRITIVIKSIRNISKPGNDCTLYNYLSSFNNNDILSLVKRKSGF